MTTEQPVPPARIVHDPDVRIFVCIPAYNEEKSIAEVVREAQIYATKVIVCDDGSSDQTYQKATEAGATVIRHSENMGKGEALKTAFRECMNYDVDFVVTIDGDRQHDPSDITRLISPLKEGRADVVIGSRFLGSKSDIPSYRQAGLSIIGKLEKYLTRIEITDSQSGFRAYLGSVLPIISDFRSSDFGVESEQIGIIRQHGLRVAEVPVTIKYAGLAHTSKAHPLAQGSQIISSILKVALERRPLLIFGTTGLIFIAISVVFGIQLIQLFNETRYFSLPLSFLSTSLAIVGLLLLVAAIVLHSNNRVRDRISDLRRDLALR
jgi:glycosyltransferase involved in cell wall biosynthesis